MTSASSQSDGSSSAGQSWREDPTFVTFLVGLLFVGMVTFAGLWLMEKGKTGRLRNDLHKARQQIVRQQQLLQFKSLPSKLPVGLPAGISPAPQLPR